MTDDRPFVNLTVHRLAEVLGQSLAIRGDVVGIEPTIAVGQTGTDRNSLDDRALSLVNRQ